MCGIFGFFDRRGASLPGPVLSAMGAAVRHRGPDDFGVFEAPGVGIGNQRLSIIDVQGGHQPFVSDDGGIAVVQNGEIFNHVELAAELAREGVVCRTRSDTEVLLRLYERHGIGFLEKLNGMFAIAIFDRRERALYLVRDRIGVKPLYLRDDGTRIVFGSEIKALFPAIDRPPMNEEALHHFLTFNYVPCPFTIYEGVHHLPPAHYLRITPTETQMVQWWELADVRPQRGRTEADWIEEFLWTLNDAVRLRLRCDVPFGAFLSGGVDSATVVGMMAHHLERPVRTFCIGFADPRFDEAPFALAASRRFKTEHLAEQVEPDMLDLWPVALHHCDQPHGDISFLPTYRVSELAAQHVKVVLTGDGGDELFAGYDKYRTFFARPDLASMSEAEFQRSYFDSISLFPHAAKLRLYIRGFAPEVQHLDSFEVARPHFEKVIHQDRINQALYLDMQLLLSGNNLVKPDRMGMAHSLEARTPFLDYRMMELAFRMPGELKLKDGVTKYLYKKAVSPLIGEELAYRKKQMFTVPVGEWFRGEKAQYCREMLKRLEPLGVFAPEAVSALAEQHIAGHTNWTRELRALISIALWAS